jgi:hypothetical protein
MGLHAPPWSATRFFDLIRFMSDYRFGKILRAFVPAYYEAVEYSKRKWGYRFGYPKRNDKGHPYTD